MVAGTDRLRRKQLLSDPAGRPADPDGAGQTARRLAFAAVCTVASVAGGALGYLIGYAVFDQLARPILNLYGYGAAYAAFQAKFQEYGLWIVLVKGLTPIPYKIVTIAAGAARFDFWLFMLASLLTRGARFFLVATLLHYYGEPSATSSSVG